MDLHTRIAKLIAAGFSQSQVATMVGLSPGRISQICKEESFLPLLQQEETITAKEFSEEKALDNKYMAVEHALLRNIEEQALGADIKDAVNALRVITERQFKKKQATSPVPVAGTIINNTVQLLLPTHTLPQRMPIVAINNQNEVTAIDDRSLAPMPSTGVLSLFKRLRKGNENEPATISAPAEEVPSEAFPLSLSPQS